MLDFMDSLSSYFSTALIIPLLGTGIYLTFRLKLVQLIRFGHAWKVITGVYDDPEHEGDISHMQALSSALSATIGIGNIAGVAIAIRYGGPGALFWMWVTALLGMATKFTEASLAMKFRKIHKDGSASGGPMYYIEKGLGKKWKPLAVFFAACTIISSFGTGNSIQAFTVADSLRGDFGISPVITGLVLATIVGLVIIGGIRRIGVVTSRLVPFMALVYITSAVIVLISNRHEILPTFGLIFSSAFTTQGAVGGFAGSTFFLALLWGVRRGIYSNEAGQGSAPIAHAAAKTDLPIREGTVAMLGPFIDTLLICTLTGLTIITSGAWNTPYRTEVDVRSEEVKVMMADQDLPLGGRPTPEMLADGDVTILNGVAEGVRFHYNNGFVVDPRFMSQQEDGAEPITLTEGTLVVEQGQVRDIIGAEGLVLETGIVVYGKALRNGSLLTAQAFEKGLGTQWGSWMVSIGVLLFAISTAISWSYYGDRATVYLFGRKGIKVYRWIYVLVVFIGANTALTVVWGFGDIALTMMAIPNLFALLLLTPTIVKMKQEYFSLKYKNLRKAHW